MNKAIIVGNLTRDPEMSTTQSGLSVTRFSVAVQRNYANASGEREVDFLNVVAWRKLAENCHTFLSKGKKVGVVGAIQTRNYETDKGEKRYVTEIIAEEVEFLTPKGEGASDNANKASKKKASLSEMIAMDDDDLPF